MKKAFPAVLAVLFLVVLPGCGSDKSATHRVTLTKDEKTAAASLKKAFTDSTTGALSSTEAGCVATKFVDTVGLAKLKSSKLLTDANQVDTASTPQFDADTAGKFADALLGCMDYQQRLADETAKTDKTVDAAKFGACLDDKLPDSLVKKMLVASQTGSSDGAALGEQANKAMTDCKASSKK
jgi:hypothetical protein